jgi:hypothetical protein
MVNKASSPLLQNSKEALNIFTCRLNITIPKIILRPNLCPLVWWNKVLEHWVSPITNELNAYFIHLI